MEKNPKGRANLYLYVFLIALASVITIGALAGSIRYSAIGIAELLGGAIGLSFIPLLLIRFLNQRAGYICLFFFVLGFAEGQLHFVG